MLLAVSRCLSFGAVVDLPYVGVWGRVSKGAIQLVDTTDTPWKITRATPRATHHRKLLHCGTCATTHTLGLAHPLGLEHQLGLVYPHPPLRLTHRGDRRPRSRLDLGWRPCGHGTSSSPQLAAASTWTDARRDKYYATAAIPDLIDRLPDSDEKATLLKRLAILVSTCEKLSASYHGAKSANDGALAHA
jgi:hypothetical protein